MHQKGLIPMSLCALHGQSAFLFVCFFWGGFEPLVWDTLPRALTVGARRQGRCGCECMFVFVCECCCLLINAELFEQKITVCLFSLMLPTISFSQLNIISVMIDQKYEQVKLQCFYLHE